MKGHGLQNHDLSYGKRSPAEQYPKDYATKANPFEGAHALHTYAHALNPPTGVHASSNAYPIFYPTPGSNPLPSTLEPGVSAMHHPAPPLHSMEKPYYAPVHAEPNAALHASEKSATKPNRDRTKLFASSHQRRKKTMLPSTICSVVPCTNPLIFASGLKTQSRSKKKILKKNPPPGLPSAYATDETAAEAMRYGAPDTVDSDMRFNCYASNDPPVGATPSCPACALPEGTLMRSSRHLCPNCVHKRTRAVAAAAATYRARYANAMATCAACGETKPVLDSFHRLGLDVRKVCKICDYQAQKERGRRRGGFHPALQKKNLKKKNTK
jgi:transposase-like protein